MSGDQRPPARPIYRKLATGVGVVCCILAGGIGWFQPDEGLFAPIVCLVVAIIMFVIAATGFLPTRRSN